MKTVLLPILLLTLPLIAGCSEPEEEPTGLTIYLHNESGYDLYKKYFINDQLYGWWWSESGAGAGTNSGSCPHADPQFEGMGIGPDDSFTFTVVMEFRDQSVFAEGSRETRCGDEFAAWVHPDGYILFEDTTTRYADPPWERNG